MSELISVIIPVYNAEKYVGNCIESLLAQTYKNIEIICVNDGSKDSSGEICDDYKSRYPNIKVIHQENGGVCVARNRGIEAAKGDFFFFVDSDDSVPETAIDSLYSKIKEYGADIVAGNATVEVSENNCKKYFDISEDEIFEGDSIIKNAADSVFYSAWGKLFSRSAVFGVRFVEGKRINEDGFFVFQTLLNAKKVVKTNDRVYNYLYHAGSACHGVFSEKYYDILYFRDRKVELLDKRYPKMKALSNAIYLKHSISFMNRLIMSGRKDLRKEIKNLRSDIRHHSKPLDYLTKRELFKLFLIKNFICVYVMIMKRGA